jgi:hypothetical protein
LLTPANYCLGFASFVQRDPVTYSTIHVGTAFGIIDAIAVANIEAALGSEQRHESCELSRRGCSKMPTLRFRDQEIAKYLDASDRLQFLGINEIGVERDGVGFAK